MALFLFWAGSMFFLDENNAARVPVLALAIYLFTAAYSPTMGPVPFVYAVRPRLFRPKTEVINFQAECYPLTHREIGMSFAVQQNNFWSSVLGLAFPSMSAALKPFGAFYFYALTNLLGECETALKFNPANRDLQPGSLSYFSCRRLHNTHSKNSITSLLCLSPFLLDTKLPSSSHIGSINGSFGNEIPISSHCTSLKVFKGNVLCHKGIIRKVAKKGE